jgi:purine-binding chemotaxis protein CheW
MTEALQQRLEAVWRERAERLSQRPVLAGVGPSILPVMVLGIGKERYGIDLADVAEVLPPVRPTPVPGTPAIVAGVINVHGEIRPVLDLARLLNMDAAPDGAPARVILLRREGREIGLQIESVEHIRWIPLTAVEASPAGASRHVRGATGDLLMLLSTEALFAELNFSGPRGATT